MRKRMDNEDEISRDARLRKEARELEEKGITPEITEEVTIEEPERIDLPEDTVPEIIPEKKKEYKKPVLKGKSKRK